VNAGRFTDVLNRLDCDAAEFSALTGIDQYAVQEWIDGTAIVPSVFERLAELLVLDADEGGSWVRKNLRLIANRLKK